jgi:hypothetical protein
MGKSGSKFTDHIGNDFIILSDLSNSTKLNNNVLCMCNIVCATFRTLVEISKLSCEMLDTRRRIRSKAVG